MLIRREKSWAFQYFGTGIWTNEREGVASGPTGAQFRRWDVSTSTPIEDVRGGKRGVHAATGMRPNTMVVGRAVYDALLDHPDIIGRLDRGRRRGPRSRCARTSRLCSSWTRSW